MTNYQRGYAAGIAAGRKEAEDERLDNDGARLDRLLIVLDRIAGALERANPIGVSAVSYPATPDGCAHEYPNPWHGIVPPCCTKCGKPAPGAYPTWEVTPRRPPPPP